MCDNRDDDLPILIKKINIKNEKCKKCLGENGKAAILLRNDDKPLCKECFLLACTHKFRAEFGKSQIIRQGEIVLVGFSGGASSYAMLELIKQGLSESQFRKLRFNPIFVHIIENESIINEVEEVLKNSGFPYFIKPQSEIDDLRLHKITECLSKKTKFATSLKSAKSIVMRDVLAKLAPMYSCTRVLLASNCSRLSMRVLSNIAQGFGVACAEDVSFHDTRYNVSIMQPMRGFSIKEISFLNTFSGFEITFFCNDETLKPRTYSIDRLTEDFLASLTPNFPSTIFTISKTADKMTYGNNEDQMNKCQFCGNLYKAEDVALDVSSAANALRYSIELLAPIGANLTDGHVTQICHRGLCYGCSIIEEEISVSLVLDDE